MTLSTASSAWTAALAAVSVYLVRRLIRGRQSRRLSVLPRNKERVLIIGASSGIGRCIAEEYAAEGARVCIVARRADEIREIEAICQEEYRVANKEQEERPVIGLAADFTSSDDMVRVRDEVQKAWSGLDTLVVCAGASALRPVMELARGDSSSALPTAYDVRRTDNVATAASRANYIGPLVSAVTFIPLLQTTSVSPSILLISSLGAIVPAPTRAIYGSTKAAGLLLYQALAIENPSIAFSYMIPATVEGDFRKSAVDLGPVREVDPNKVGLKRDVVARRCIDAVDFEDKAVFMPAWARPAHLLYWLWPSFIERAAMKKYNFSS